jgi:hypothetical protein
VKLPLKVPLKLPLPDDKYQGLLNQGKSLDHQSSRPTFRTHIRDSKLSEIRNIEGFMDGANAFASEGLAPRPRFIHL